jgi:hypothetical protein
MYGIKVSDQSMAEPAKLRLGWHEVASYDAIEEDLGHFWLVIRGGNPNDDTYFAWVFELNDGHILHEVCQCIEHNIQECFRQRHPDADVRHSGVDNRSSILSSMRDHSRSKAALLVETAACRNVTSSVISQEAVLDARVYRDALIEGLNEEVGCLKQLL